VRDINHALQLKHLHTPAYTCSVNVKVINSACQCYTCIKDNYKRMSVQ